MRIVAVADTHLFHEDFQVFPKGDVFIHAGDLLRGGSLDELRTGAAWLRSLPYRHKIFVAGNHDWCFARDLPGALEVLGPGIVYLQDSETVIDGVRFWGSPWQPEFNNWAFNLPRGEPLAEKWRLIPEAIDVLITHGPPHGIGDRSGVDKREGCEDLLARVREIRPVLHLFGHIHQDGGCCGAGGTWFVNVTAWECERGLTVLDLDHRGRRVTVIGVPPA
jgi:predicted phosphohydrolase